MDIEESAQQQEADDEVVWSREWEGPGWTQAVGEAARSLRGWRPDGRTLAVVLGLLEAGVVAQTVPIAVQLWRAVTASPEPASPLFGPDPRFRWEQLIAGTELVRGLAAALVVLGAVVVLLWPRRLPGHVALLAGLALSVVSEVGLVVAEVKLDIGAGLVAGLAVVVVLSLALLVFAGYTARCRQESIPSSPQEPSPQPTA